MYFVLKIMMTAIVVACVSELSRRYSLIAAALVSLPLTSILAFILTYQETKDNAKIIELSGTILWLLIPSALFFIVLPLLLKSGLKFYPSLLLSCLFMAVGYSLFIWLKKAMGY
ncbi:MAG: DUF3147 family protein [Alphaproteobacteria bacterium]|nr:DUF3147 family protein [Alphaproteobacteria bacterium]